MLFTSLYNNKTLINYKRLVVVYLSLIVNNKTLINYKRLVVVYLSLLQQNTDKLQEVSCCLPLFITTKHWQTTRGIISYILCGYEEQMNVYFFYFEQKSIFKVNYLCFRFKPSMQIYTRRTKTPRINLERSVPFPKLTVKTIKICHFQI